MQSIDKREGFATEAVHVMVLHLSLRSGSETIRVSLLKLPRLPGKLIACFPKTPPTLKQMPPDGVETKKISYCL